MAVAERTPTPAPAAAPARGAGGRASTGRARDWALGAWSALALLYLFIPVFIVVLFSFNDNIIPSLPFRGFTLQWYRELGFDFVLHDALYNSLVIASITTVTSTVIGTLAAFPLVRSTFALKRAAQAMMIVPMVIPHFLMGVALLLFFAFVHLPLSRLTVVLGHVVFTVPFAILIVSIAAACVDRAWTSNPANVNVPDTAGPPQLMGSAGAFSPASKPREEAPAIKPRRQPP